MYQITVNKTFRASHAIRLEDGSFEPMHDHDWRIDATVSADQLDSIETVMDFHVLQRWLDTAVAGAENHSLNDIPAFVDQGISPTAERVAWWIGRIITKQLPANLRLTRVAVTEAPGCTAIYTP